MIVFAAFTPHSPLLLESINKERLKEAKKTLTGLEELSHELYATHPDTIVLISSHPNAEKDAFTLYVHDPFEFDLSALGDSTFKSKFHPDLHLVDTLQRHLRSEHQPITLTTEAHLNHTAAIPLNALATNIKNIKLLPISTSAASPKAHFQFGQALRESLISSTRRIAIIASGDLAHTLSSYAPGGFHDDGAAFDKTIQDLITSQNSTGIMGIDETLKTNAQETAHLPLCMLLGVLDRTANRPHIISYEAPFGVGELIVNFTII